MLALLPVWRPASVPSDGADRVNDAADERDFAHCIVASCFL